MQTVIPPMQTNFLNLLEPDKDKLQGNRWEAGEMVMISGEKFIEYLKSEQIPPEPPEGCSIGGHDWSIGKYGDRQK